MDDFSGVDLLEARQFIAILLGLMSIVLVGVFGRYLIREVRVYGIRNVRKFRVNQAAIAMMVYFLFMAGTRAWSAILYEVLQGGGDVLAFEDTYPVAFTMSVGALIGGMCIIRVFTENHWTWFISLVAIVSVTLGFYAIHP